MIKRHILDHGTVSHKELSVVREIIKKYQSPIETHERRVQLSKMLREDMKTWHQTRSLGSLSGHQCYQTLLFLGDRRAASKLFDHARRETILTEKWFATRIQHCAKRQRQNCLRNVAQIRKEMIAYFEKNNLSDTAPVYIAFLTVFTLTKNYSQAKRLLLTMTKLGIKFNTNVYLCIIEMSDNYKDTRDFIISKTPNETLADCNPAVYHSLLRRFGSTDFNTASEIVADMKKDKFPIKTKAINILLNASGCCSQSWKLFHKTYEYINNPNTETLTIYLTHALQYIRRSSVEDGKTIYKKVLSDFYASTVTVNITSIAPFVPMSRIFSHFQHYKRLKSLYEASHTRGLNPSKEFLRIVVVGLRRGGMLEAAEMIDKNELQKAKF